MQTERELKLDMEMALCFLSQSNDLTSANLAVIGSNILKSKPFQMNDAREWLVAYKKVKSLLDLAEGWC